MNSYSFVVLFLQNHLLNVLLSEAQNSLFSIRETVSLSASYNVHLIEHEQNNYCTRFAVSTSSFMVESKGNKEKFQRKNALLFKFINIFYDPNMFLSVHA